MAHTMRMRRLFNGEDNRLLDVAIDHGVFNEDRFLNGIEGILRLPRLHVWPPWRPVSRCE